MRLACLLAAAVVAFVSGCGADAGAPAAPEFPEGAIAEVDGRTISGAELGAFMAEVQASYDAQKRPLPDEGSPEYRNVIAHAIDTLVRNIRDEALAADLGVVVTDGQVDAVIDRTRRLNGGDEVDRTIAEAAVSPARYRATVRMEILRHEIFKAVVANAAPTEEELRAHYEASRKRVPFEEAVEGIRLELGWEKQAAAMKAWKAEHEARLISLTRYAQGWNPQELRGEVPFPAPPKQKRFGACGLPDGEYTYEELLEQGCAGDFPIPGRDGPPCPEQLVEIPFTGGFSYEEVESGYSEYLARIAGACVSDPRGETIGFYTDLEHRPALSADD
jgi:hypothetical protein